MNDFVPQNPEWKVFSLTYIEYPAGDYIGKALSVLSLAPLVSILRISISTEKLTDFLFGFGLTK
jgi:hypothetical protein